MTERNAIHTEAEARERACPLSFGATHDATAQALGCLASKCMAWRWFATHVSSEADHGELIKRGDAYGYCGLAGDPRCRS